MMVQLVEKTRLLERQPRQARNSEPRLPVMFALGRASPSRIEQAGPLHPLKRRSLLDFDRTTPPLLQEATDRRRDRGMIDGHWTVEWAITGRCPNDNDGFGSWRTHSETIATKESAA